ncbi:MAG TPA: GAF domain-containing protein, partial [Chloroflexota bacterium]|nr:GAF domain-containing protein [Chloroflexota bacterium]
MRRYLTVLGEIGLAGDVPLDTLLQEIVDRARELLNARYAALGIFDSTGQIQQLFSSGLSAEDGAKIGRLPRGAGLLGLIAVEGRIIRLARIADHPQSVGFPPNHPPMNSFLGGPISRNGKVYGNLYFTDRQEANEFSVADEELLQIFCEQAALAIENAERFASLRRSELAIRALFEASRILASLDEPSAVLHQTAREARRILAADVAGLCLREAGGKTLRWSFLDGSISDFYLDTSIPVESSIAGQVIVTGRSFVSSDLSSEPGVASTNRFLSLEKVRSVVVVPLGAAKPSRGALMVGWRVTGVPPVQAAEILDQLADRAELALARAELHAREQVALRQSQVERSSLEAIFDSMTDAVLTTDLDGRIVRMNRRACTWAGRAAADVTGQQFSDVFQLVDEVGQTQSTPSDIRSADLDLILVRSDGERVPVERAISPITGTDGQSLGTVQVLRDLRPQREVEQLKANIVSLVSHELRTPLSHIKGYASSLLQPDVQWDAEIQRDFIASIDRQADRLARLISDLLEISRLDAGGTATMERIPIAATALVERGIRQAEPNAVGHPIETIIPPDLPLVFADVSHIERVLSNLIENAAKYSPSETTITVELCARADSVVFAVHDHGTGMTPEEMAHLFERFYRSPRVKHRTPGTGLGLAICREIVQAHGGKIWADTV